MLISREWLQTYFEKPLGRSPTGEALPRAEKLAEALTFHAFEIESVEKAGDDNVLDVKITPNRGHDCLSVRGIAKELSAILKLPMKSDPLREQVSLEPKTEEIKVTIEDAKLCPRFTGALIKGITVGSSPEWLKKRLETVGQKSINNVVDATNYVMFGLGQPLHAFDVAKLTEIEGTRALNVRLAKKGEKLLGLDDKTYELEPSMLVIEDSYAENPVSIAGIKGGKPTGVGEGTVDIFLEAANWDGAVTRKTSAVLKLRTDASERFQQVISSEIAAHGLRAAADLIVELAGGKVEGFVDVYPSPQSAREVSVMLEHINSVLGVALKKADAEEVLTRLNLPHTTKNGTFTVAVPFERLDIEIPEDLIEEVGRIVGYENVPAVELPAFSEKPAVNPNFFAAERAREELLSEGYSEVYTSVFAEKGERSVANKVGGEKPYLRTTLIDGLGGAYGRNVHNQDVLGLSEIKIFEIGVVWKGKEEKIMLGVADTKGVHETPLKPEPVENYEQVPLSNAERYQSFSKYPFVVRDIALWVPAEAQPEEVLEAIRTEAGELLVKSNLFDQFEKDNKISYAFRLVFQSFEKTLTDAEVNAIMDRVASKLTEKGWKVR